MKSSEANNLPCKSDSHFSLTSCLPWFTPYTLFPSFSPLYCKHSGQAVCVLVAGIPIHSYLEMSHSTITHWLDSLVLVSSVFSQVPKEGKGWTRLCGQLTASPCLAQSHLHCLFPPLLGLSKQSWRSISPNWRGCAWYGLHVHEVCCAGGALPMRAHGKVGKAVGKALHLEKPFWCVLPQY